jgi:release factor glutamine methyltransferase
LASFASERLKKGGILAVEINQKLGNETVDIFKIAGLTNIKLIKDMSGNNRLITSQKD